MALASPDLTAYTATMNQAMVLTQDAIRQAVERPDREKTAPKKLPDTILCRLLGLSGLKWEEQHLLAPIWLSLHQQPDKTARGLVLQTFFKILANKHPRLVNSEAAHCSTTS